jgi:SulP family sulfate permease
MRFWDGRFEDLTAKTWKQVLYRDASAGLIVAMTAIPMAMGFAIAMGLRPEQGIIAGALACLIGRTFGGSKYQVYGPTAAFIPLIASLMHKYGEAGGGSAASAHGFLVFVSVLSGIALIAMGLLGMGKYAKYVPNSIVVGFTVGIAVAIALSNLGEILGLKVALSGSLFDKLGTVFAHLGEVNAFAILLALGTFALTKSLLRISIFVPAPLIAIGASTLLGATVLSSSGVVLVRDKFGSIPSDFFVFTGPLLPAFSLGMLGDVFYFVVAIVFVSGVESLLCSSMADRLADNRGTPFNPDKEFFGQGMVQIFTPLVNGFPCTGALARTATSIKAGAVSPFAGYFKGVFKLAMAYFMAPLLEAIPMACIGGILLWVSSNMIKKTEIMEVWAEGRFESAMMVYTAVMVPVTDFLTGVLSALVVYWVLKGLFKQPVAHVGSPALSATFGSRVRTALQAYVARNEDAWERHATLRARQNGLAEPPPGE